MRQPVTVFFFFCGGVFELISCKCLDKFNLESDHTWPLLVAWPGFSIVI